MANPFLGMITERISNDEESCREHVLPHCHRGSAPDEDAFIASIFSKKPDEIQREAQVDRDKFDLVKGYYL